MLAKVMSCATVGLDGAVVEVETDITPGLPFFAIVGLPDVAVQEAKERVRAAIRNSGFTFPMKRIAVNLAPADIKKEGPSYDLSIAMAILISSEQVAADTSKTVFLGELSMDGSLRHTNGILPMVAVAREQGFSTIVVPQVDAKEAALIDGVKIIPIASLAQLTSCLQGETPIPEYKAEPTAEDATPSTPVTDLAYIKGQEHVKRALEVAAAGGHNIIMMGPPGSGKTLLARSLPSILPPMSSEEALEVTKIYSVSGLLPPDTSMMRHRPFRAPHYTISNAGLVGGGHFPKPGEISLSQGSIKFPASFMLAGAMNPCPCGFYGDPVRQCTCPPGIISRYQRRISGPFIDRVDIFVEVPHIAYEKLADDRLGEKSEKVQARVKAARSRQLERFKGSKLTCNAEMTPTEVREFCRVEADAQSLLKMAMKQLYLSARAFHRILKLARTIADLENADTIKSHHLAEAIQYRPRSQA